LVLLGNRELELRSSCGDTPIAKLRAAFVQARTKARGSAGRTYRFSYRFSSGLVIALVTELELRLRRNSSNN